MCLRGIAQMAMADGVEDPRERAYLDKFVDEFFPDTDPTDDAWNAPVSNEDLAKLTSDEARQCFLGYAFITAYVDEEFVQAEEDLLNKWAEHLVDSATKEDIATSVREFLYRRSVFAYAFRLGRLDEEFAVAAAKRFDVPVERAKELNATVFNAIMTLRRPEDGEAPPAESDAASKD
ncbi:MAG: hypothetical protein ABI333_04975 [bacterium]